MDSNVAPGAGSAPVPLASQWTSLFSGAGAGGGIPLGTAQFMPPGEAVASFAYGSEFNGRIWFGEGFDQVSTSLGYEDDRHVCVVSGSRGGKGVGVIVPNLCYWPGSAIVIDPKGENATVTARRRGSGSDYAHALGQKVHVLDPFGEVELPKSYRARYNPLDAIDPKGDFAIDDAGRIASALVVIENRHDPFWEESARSLIKALILHVLSAPYLEGHRNLVTVRRFIAQGDWLTLEKQRQAGIEDPPSAFSSLWERMRLNPAFNGLVAGAAEQMIELAERTRSGILGTARTSTDFLDSVPMQRLVETSDFDLGDLKRDPKGISIYLTLPQRYMETHYRWLRLMISLAVGEMEQIKGRPASGFPTLFVLDEFAGLKRMEVIENAAAQAAGFGVKFMFVVQNLPQIEELYQKSWETFIGNSGLKIFFQIDDDFTRNYLTRQLGEFEVSRETQSSSRSTGTSSASASGTSDAKTTGKSSGFNFSLHPDSPWTHSRGRNRGSTQSSFSSSTMSSTDNTTAGWNEGLHKRNLLNPDEIGRLLARIDNRERPGYPGLVLALIPGRQPSLARRVNYFESHYFEGFFDPRPGDPTPRTLAELATPLLEDHSETKIEAQPARKTTSIWGRGGVGLVVCFALIVLAMVLLIGQSPQVPSNTSVSRPPPKPSEVIIRYAKVTAPQLNLRAGPAPSYPSLFTLDHDARSLCCARRAMVGKRSSSRMGTRTIMAS